MMRLLLSRHMETQIRCICCCADLDAASKRRTIISASTIAAFAAAVLAAAAALITWRLRQRPRDSFKFSHAALKKLGSSSAGDLSFELDKNGNLILLGKGAFGEVTS